MVLLLVVGDFWQCFVIFWVANNIAILKSDLLALRRMRTCSLLVSPMSGLLTILEFLDYSYFFSTLLQPLLQTDVWQRCCGQRRGRRHLQRGICEECDEQQVHPQYAQRLEEEDQNQELTKLKILYLGLPRSLYS